MEGMMSDNSIISEARGECYHVNDCFSDGCPVHEGTITECPHTDIVVDTDDGGYDYDLSAWTPELFKFIEDKGLVMSYLKFLDLTVNPNDIDTSLPMGWYRHKATPANKANALAKAIKESSQG